MVKFYSSDYSYDYGFSAVSLAYFLRYPNPYSRHVSSTDTISREFDPNTQRLTTVRLHVKRSRIPPAVLKLLPGSFPGANEDGSTRSFILEKSVVDVKEGWMQTESRNLDWNNVLSVIERHTFRRPAALQIADASAVEEKKNNSESKQQSFAARFFTRAQPPLQTSHNTLDNNDESRTEVSVSVILKSRIGEQIRKQRQRWSAPSSPAAATEASVPVEEEAPRQSWFNSWTSGAMRSAIENIGLQRTEKSQPKAQKGMSVVLDRLRNGGWEAVLAGMQADQEMAPA